MASQLALAFHYLISYMLSLPQEWPIILDPFLRMIDVKEEKRTLPKGPAVVSSSSRIAVKTLNPAASGTFLTFASFRTPTIMLGSKQNKYLQRILSTSKDI